MKIEILRENLERAVQLVSKVSNKNLSLPVLGCVVFFVEGSRAVLRATNLDVSVEVLLKAKVIEPGVVAVPAHIISATVAALSDEKLTLSVKESTLSVSGERGSSSITAIDSSEFPNLPSVKSADEVVVSGRELVLSLKSVAFSASTSSVKPELAAVSLTLEKGELVSAATDSFRLAEMRLPMKIKQGFQQTLLPARNIPDIIRAIEDASQVSVKVGENQCTFASDFGFITSRTVDGAFPDYRAIIPKEASSAAIALKEDAVRAFRKIAIFADAYSQVHLALKASEKMFMVSAASASVGETKDKIPAQLSGEDIEMNFNARYITDALAVVSGDGVQFSIAGEGKPMLITDSPARGFTYLVMPMNR